MRNPKALEDLIGYLEKRRAYIPDYGERQRVGLWIASTRVEKFNDWAVSGRCKHQGMSWSAEGVLALAALEAAAERRTRRLAADGCAARATVARPGTEGGLRHDSRAPTGER